MAIQVLDEVVELLRLRHVGGWEDFRPSYNTFKIRHCHPKESEIECMTRFWRYLVSASHMCHHDRSVALSALCEQDSAREWINNFKQYILSLLDDLYVALEDYHD